jgi:DNA polymerase
MTNAPRITIDFESRSACDIGRGAWLYSKHASTEPLCLAYKIGNAKTKLWHPGYAHLGIEESPYPQDLMDAIDDGWLVEAHNRFFEYCLWSNIMQPLWGWRPIKREQWRCSAAKAAYYSLPRALENAVKALKMSVEKDMEGNKIMKKLCKPRKPTKLERSKLLQDGVDPDTVVLWHESVEDFERNWLYCENDVEAEHAFSELLPDLPPEELRIWQMDQDMNLRGIRCDLTMVRSALRMRDREVSAMNAELADIMGVPDNEREGFGASQRAKVKDWINVQGVALPDTQAATLDKFAERKLPAEILAAINIVREVTARPQPSTRLCSSAQTRLTGASVT